MLLVILLYCFPLLRSKVQLLIQWTVTPRKPLLLVFQMSAVEETSHILSLEEPNKLKVMTILILSFWLTADVTCPDLPHVHDEHIMTSQKVTHYLTVSWIINSNIITIRKLKSLTLLITGKCNSNKVIYYLVMYYCLTLGPKYSLAEPRLELTQRLCHKL